MCIYVYCSETGNLKNFYIPLYIIHAIEKYTEKQYIVYKTIYIIYFIKISFAAKQNI